MGRRGLHPRNPEGQPEGHPRLVRTKRAGLNLKNRKKLLNPEVWRKHRDLVRTAETLMADIGDGEFDDFNRFGKRVDGALKARKIRLSPPDKKAVLNAVSWYDEGAARVIRKKERLSGDKLDALLDHLRCSEADLPDFGYYPTDKKGEYLTCEPCPDLRDLSPCPSKTRSTGISWPK